MSKTRQLIVKTVLFQATQFSISTKFGFIWPIYWTLSGASTPGQSGLMRWQWREYSAFPKASTLLEPHIRLFSIKFRTLVEGGFYLSAEVQLVYSTPPPQLTGQYVYIYIYIYIYMERERERERLREREKERRLILAIIEERNWQLSSDLVSTLFFDIYSLSLMLNILY